MKILVPRVQTPAPGAPDGRHITGRPPDEMMSEQVRRLALCALIGAGLWSFGAVINTFLTPLTAKRAATSWMAVPVDVAGILTSLLMYAYARYSSHAAGTKINVGLGYMVACAAGVGFLSTWVYSPATVSSSQISWNTLVILVSSMILQTTPRRMLAAALVAASMDPLFYWLAYVRGLPVAPAWAAVVVYLPTYVCAVIAMLPSSVLQRLGRRLREAQDFGSYRLVELLGHGGMGEVWRAEHRLLARDVAIKLVRPEVLGAGDAAGARVVLQRFEREARATAALSSPHTIDVFDYGMTQDRTLYYAMELLVGRDLETLVREFGPVPADRALFLLRQVCHSLADAHARGLVHRDIKPANIYVCRKGLDYDFVKVLDFGLVKVEEPGAVRLTLEGVGQTTGTPAYMAPEIILGGTEVDRRADVYALGCVAYYLLTGQLVFEADTPMKMLLQHLQARPVPPSSRTELKIPREIDEFVLACLEKDPNDRPQDARELWMRACGCRECETWNQDAARSWWETYLPELTGSLSLSEHPPDAAGRVVA
jgi:eukaryotic-like serine/threonine-protein kinase